MQVGPLSVVMNVAEAPISAGAEVSGASASATEIPANGRFVLLRQGTRLHGPSAASTIEVGLYTEGHVPPLDAGHDRRHGGGRLGRPRARQAARPSARSS